MKTTKDIAHRWIVLKLNKRWDSVGVGKVGKTICDLMTGVVEALDIEYNSNPDGTPDFNSQSYVNPVKWDEWIKLPVRPWDLSIHSRSMSIRVPTVVIAVNYDTQHEKTFKGKPTKEGLFIRDGGRDGYTGLEEEYENLCIDHVIPKFRGGEDTYENTVLTTKETNNKKGHKLNSEAGLTLMVTPCRPDPIKVSQTIKKARHHDWYPFIRKKAKGTK